MRFIFVGSHAQVKTLQVVQEENVRLEASNSVLEQQLSASSPNTSVCSPSVCLPCLHRVNTAGVFGCLKMQPCPWTKCCAGLAQHQHKISTLLSCA